MSPRSLLDGKSYWPLWLLLGAISGVCLVFLIGVWWTLGVITAGGAVDALLELRRGWRR